MYILVLDHSFIMSDIRSTYGVLKETMVWYVGTEYSVCTYWPCDKSGG